MKNAQSVLTVVLFAAMLSAPRAAGAQGGAAVYVVQFGDLKAQMGKMAARAEALADHGTPIQKAEFLEDSLALLKLVHRLGEGAAESNTRVMRQGAQANKRLLLISVAATALTVESMALDGLVHTGDSSFKAAARDADAVATNLGKGM